MKLCKIIKDVFEIFAVHCVYTNNGVMLSPFPTCDLVCR